MVTNIIKLLIALWLIKKLLGENELVFSLTERIKKELRNFLEPFKDKK